MTSDQKKAYEWAKNQNYPSVAARYAKELAWLVDGLQAAPCARKEQERNDWVCTLKCEALIDEGMCSHGGLCCLYESQRTIKESEPLTLDELREMDGEPVWVCFIDGVVMRDDGWFILALLNESQAILEGKHPVYKNLSVYGKTWLAYRQKPEEKEHGV